ncbi:MULTISPECIES: cytosolic protein [Vibrio]|uniref:Cytosolic protein n=1 Tax=Vibrio casei TaxID=673372 RepID=A0A368LIM2_9VIBR|nr:MULTISPECIES: cytosolic protein [Vibrio]RCS70476.1 cytosolic protein [Vibrio casei]SJN28129.1 hypothetical protein FM109_08220 [Vibrio casei]HBV77933.1 cytosolic protein [Vibrio sp.]
MKLLYWLSEWLSLSPEDQQAKLPHSGSSLLDDVFVKYDLLDVNKPLLFTFSPSGTDIKGQDLNENFSPWGYQVARQQQVNVISFQHLGVSNWFRNPNLIHFLEQLSSMLTPFQCRLGYGLSRGGFAIGAFANLLKLNHVLLFYPVSTKNKMLVPWDGRSSTELAQQFNWENNYHDRNLGEANGYIIYDPTNDIDKLHAQRYPKLIQFKVVGMGHGVHPNDLDRQDFYNQMVEQFIQHQKIDISQFNEQAKTQFLKED